MGLIKTIFTISMLFYSVTPFMVSLAPQTVGILKINPMIPEDKIFKISNLSSGHYYFPIPLHLYYKIFSILVHLYKSSMHIQWHFVYRFTLFQMYALNTKHSMVQFMMINGCVCMLSAYDIISSQYVIQSNRVLAFILKK